MSKNLFIIALSALLSMTLCPLLAQNTSRNCKVNDFTAIKLESVGNLIFTQSADFSCRVEGSAENVKNTLVTVDDNTLIISHKQSQLDKVKNLTFFISAPDLRAVKIAGVGNFTAKEVLKLRNVSFQLDGVGNFEVKNLRCDELKANVNGVGNMNLNVNCCNVNAEVSGVGSITLSGKADMANLRREGVGEIDHKNLKCDKLTSKR